MRRNISNSILVVAMLAFSVGCRTKKAVIAVPKAVEKPVNEAAARKSEQLKLLSSKDLYFNTLSLKAKANLDINGNSNSVTMNIRMQRDEKIWVSITGFAGIEGARALITPDSIKVRNNLQGVYLKKPFSYAYKFTNKQVDFRLLQSILSGNTIAAFMKETSDLKEENGVWVLSGQQQDLAYRMLFNTLMKIGEDNLNDVLTGQALKVQYGAYQKINEALFPSSVKINSVAGKQKISIDLDFSKIDSNVPLDFPFTVPKKYEVIN